MAPWVTPDGRFVLFTSSASDLVPGDSGRIALNVFLRDRASNVTTLVSANLNGGGGNSNSMFGMISKNGRYVLFQSEAGDLVAGDTNNVSDVFLRDLQLGTTVLVSAGTNGQWGNGPSTDAVMTPDAAFVVFRSEATNLVAGDTNGISDVFIRDVNAAITHKVSVGAVRSQLMSPTLTSFSPESVQAITPDGRYVVFVSPAAGLAAGVEFDGTPYYSLSEVYVRDLVASTTRWVSSNAFAMGFPGPALSSYVASHRPSISDDGRYISFKTGRSTQSSGLSGGSAVVLRYDAADGTLTLVTTNALDRFAQSDDIYGPVMTPDGRFIAITEGQTNPSFSTVLVWDGQTGSNTVVSVDTLGNEATNTVSHTPDISPDGRYVTFLSNAGNLVGNAVSNGFHIYLRDLQSATTLLVDVDTNGVGSTDQEGTIPSSSADKQLIAFDSHDGRLVASDFNKAPDVFLRNTTNGTTELISARDPAVSAQTGNGVSMIPPFSVSDNGRWVAFASHASDLVPNDDNGSPDVFIYDRSTGSNTLVSAGTNGKPATGGYSLNPVISADGRYVAYVSAATNIHPIAPLSGTRFSQIYRYDRETGSNALISLVIAGVPYANGNCFGPTISEDGRFIAFFTAANNLGGPAGVYRFDAATGTNTYMPSSASVSTLPAPVSMSRDGRWVAFAISPSSQGRVFDANNLTNVFTTQSGVSSLVLSPSGTRVLYRTNDARLSVAELGGSTNITLFTSRVVPQTQGQWSANDRFLAFVTSSNAVAGDGNGTNDVYLYDFFSRTMTLVSVNAALNNSGSGPSESPAVSGDGRFVVFRSFATNLVPGGVSVVPNIYVYDRFAGSNTLLSPAQSGIGWSPWVSTPVISGNGATISFNSWRAGIVPDDLNRVADGFAAVVGAAVDSDGDGLPDQWTTQHFDHPTGNAGDLSRAEDDADGDGMTNLEEFAAGTDPTDSNSVLRLQITLAIAGDSVTLNWTAATGRGYRVQYRNSLDDSQWLDAPGGVVINGSVGSYAAPPSSESRFYRVLTGL